MGKRAHVFPAKEPGNGRSLITLCPAPPHSQSASQHLLFFPDAYKGPSELHPEQKAAPAKKVGLRMTMQRVSSPDPRYLPIVNSSGTRNYIPDTVSISNGFIDRICPIILHAISLRVN